MSFCFSNPLSCPSPTQEGRKKPDTGQNQDIMNIMTTSHSPTRKWKHKNKRISYFPVFPVMAFNNKSPNTQSRHVTVIQEASSPDHNTASPYHPHQDIPCRLAPRRLNAQSHTKPSARLQISFVTTATTGMNFVQTRTLLEPSRRLQ